MDQTVAEKLKEIQGLADLARQKRKELDDQVSKLSRERFFHLQQAEERKIQIQELREGIKQLPPVQVKDLGSAILAALNGLGAKTLRDICEITGLKNKAVSQRLQTLVANGYVERILEEGRKRGAYYKTLAPWPNKPWPTGAALSKLGATDVVTTDRISFSNKKTPRQSEDATEQVGRAKKSTSST